MRTLVASNKHKWIDLLAVLAGLLYCSWPLGGLLNPVVAAHGLASDLGGIHQPYSWVFIAGDSLSSLLILVVCWWLWQQFQLTKLRRVAALVLVNVVIFAIGTILAAALPLHCDPAVQSCPTFLHDNILLVHGLGSILSSLCLFFSAVVLWYYKRTPLLNAIIVGYVLFGASAVFTSFGAHPSNWSQHYYITLCAVWLALLPLELRTVSTRLPIIHS